MTPGLPRLAGSSTAAKPKVLLVDDHLAVLLRVSSLLSDDFEVVGLATDGQQAIDMAQQSAPDVIVLDISMPGRDGFELKHALDEAGSAAPVVFLSSADGEVYVSEAFRHGGRGYVVKSQVVRDLPGALDHVRSGRVFVPSLASLLELADPGGHAVQLQRSPEAALDGLATFCHLALRRGDATFLIGTKEMRDGIERRLRASGWDVGQSGGHPRYQVVDTDDALRRCMRDGTPDPRVLQEMISELDQYRRATSEGLSGRVTVFGTLSGTLLARGNAAAAFALEECWDKLTHDRPFLTLCGYDSSSFYGANADLWSGTCDRHWAVNHTTDL